MTLHERHRDWLTARGLDPELAERLGLETVRDSKGNWLAVPYVEAGEVINHKYRLTSEKQHRMDSGAPLSLWNVDCLSDPKVRNGQMPVVITEGEWDALAAIQSGFPYTVSVPNGAPSAVTADLDQAKRYEWVDRHLETLKGVREFILAADDDPAGHYLRADMAALFGADRCRFVEYPFPCKDLNEVLKEYGPQRVAECISTAKPYPVQGIYTIDDFPERGEVRSYSVGVSPIEEMIRVVPGTLTVLTGYANMGKSTLMNAIIGHTMVHHFPVCVASFETDVKPILHDGLRLAILQCAKHELASHPKRKAADECIRERLTVISQTVDEDTELDLDTFLDLCRVAVTRHGAKMIILDPWNELEHKRRRDETETDYIGRAIRAIKRFAKQYDVAFWVVAHPTKPQQGSKSVPGLYDISGCHSEDTEVLTKRGWLRHDALTYDDEIGCFDPETSGLTYQKPSRIIRKPFVGDLYRFKGYGFDQCVTPDHRMLVKPKWADPTGTQAETGIGRPVRWEKDKWSFCEAQDLPSAPFAIPIAAPLQDAGADEISPLLAKLAGWFVSEGCWQSSGVSIAQAADTDGAHKIEALLTAMEVPFTVTRSAPGGKGGKLPGNSYYIGVRGAREVVAWLREHCGKGSANKRIPEPIMAGTPELKRAFLSAYLDGDGHLRTNGTYSATTTSATLRDQLQRMAIELGISCCWHERASQSERHAPSWMLSFGSEGRREAAVRTYRSLSKVPYSGDVWCLTVPTGAYVTRRNGKASVSGNSANWANKADYGLSYHRPNFKENRAKITVCKVRQGYPGRRDEVEVMFDYRTSTFQEVA